MSQTFPTLKPSQRQFTLGAFPTKVYRSLAGTTVKRSYGNKPSGFGLTLEFTNVGDAIVLTNPQSLQCDKRRLFALCFAIVNLCWHERNSYCASTGTI
jgi:hypothetical protein